jgi:hypothetical protein
MSTSDHAFVIALTTLNCALSKYKDIWSEEPFQQPKPALMGKSQWQQTNPDLYQFLIQLSDEEQRQLESSPEQLKQALTPFLPELEECSDIEEDMPSTTQPSNLNHQLPNRFSDGINGRKWQQILAFCGEIAPAQNYVDWCCGKGHLARTLSALHGSHVSGLEWDAKLCESGNALANKQNRNVSIYQYDVLSEKPLPNFYKLDRPSSEHHLALHACGDLHINMMTKSIAAKATELSIAPCCFHKTQQALYQPLSRKLRKLQQSEPLQLTRDQLKLAVQETVTAPNRDQHQRHQLKLWRLAFTRIRQHQCQTNQYLPSPSVSPKLLQHGFEYFCSHLAQLCHFSLSSNIQYQEYLLQAEQELRIIERLELARHAFRRPLELWLVLDRALYLLENNYQVSIKRFCSRQLTPRNLLLQARLITPE